MRDVDAVGEERDVAVAGAEDPRLEALLLCLRHGVWLHPRCHRLLCHAAH